MVDILQCPLRTRVTPPGWISLRDPPAPCGHALSHCAAGQGCAGCWPPAKNAAAGCEQLARLLAQAGAAVRVALDVKVMKCRFSCKRAQRYIRLRLFPSTFS
jgi:hypothetical protein